LGSLFSILFISQNFFTTSRPRKNYLPVASLCAALEDLRGNR
jgi:hypothetical protein